MSISKGIGRRDYNIFMSPNMSDIRPLNMNQIWMYWTWRGSWCTFEWNKKVVDFWKPTERVGLYVCMRLSQKIPVGNGGTFLCGSMCIAIMYYLYNFFKLLLKKIFFTCLLSLFYDLECLLPPFSSLVRYFLPFILYHIFVFFLHIDCKLLYIFS